MAARQSDAAGNTGLERADELHGRAGGRASRPTSRSSRLEESLADAAAGRLTALSSCEAACSRSTSLAVSLARGREARPAAQGQPRRCGSAAAPRAPAPAGVKVRMTPQGAPRARATASGAKATLATAAGSVSLARAIALRPELAPARGREARAEAGRHLLGAVHDRGRLIVSATARAAWGSAPEAAAWRSAARASMQPPPRPAPSRSGSPAACAAPCPARSAPSLTLEVTVIRPQHGLAPRHPPRDARVAADRS